MKIQANILAIFFISVIFFGVVYGKVDDDVSKKGMKQNADKCDANEECQSGNCRKGNCAPLLCRNDKACIKAGLKDHYCRRRGPKIFESECVTKRGIYLVL